MYGVLNEHCEKKQGYQTYRKILLQQLKDNPKMTWDVWSFVSFFSQKDHLSKISPEFLMAIGESYLMSSDLCSLKKRSVDNEPLVINLENLVVQLKKTVNATHINLEALFALFCIEVKTKKTPVLKREELATYEKQLNDLLKSQENTALTTALANYLLILIEHCIKTKSFEEMKQVLQTVFHSADYTACFQEAAEQNCYAQFMMGVSYSHLASGTKIECLKKNYEDIALGWFQLAAAKGHLRARYELATLLGKAKDYVKVMKLDLQSSLEGHPAAQFRLAALYTQACHYVQAVEWFTRSAEQGFSNAQYTLSTSYRSGKHVPQNNELSDFWCQKAVEQEHLHAINKSSQPSLKITFSDQVVAEVFAPSEQRLLLAFKNDEVTIVSTFFDKYPDRINITIQGAPPLYLAARFGSRQILDYLLLNGATTVDPIDKLRNLLFWISQNQNPFFLCGILEKHLKKLNSEDNITLSHLKAIQGDIDFFNSHTALLEQPSRNGFTPLNYAILARQNTFVKYFTKDQPLALKQIWLQPNDLLTIDEHDVLLAAANLHMGLYMMAQDYFSKAIDCFVKTKTLVSSIDKEKILRDVALFNLSQCHYHVGLLECDAEQFNLAADNFQGAVDHFSTIKGSLFNQKTYEIYCHSATFGNVRAAYNEEDPKEKKIYINKTITLITRPLEWRDGFLENVYSDLTECFRQLALFHSKQGDYKSEADSYQQAIYWYLKIKPSTTPLIEILDDMLHRFSIACKRMARSYQKRGQWLNAILFYQAALTINAKISCRKDEDESLKASYYLRLAEVYCKPDRYQNFVTINAIKSLQQSLKCFKAIKAKNNKDYKNIIKLFSLWQLVSADSPMINQLATFALCVFTGTQNNSLPDIRQSFLNLCEYLRAPDTEQDFILSFSYLMEMIYEERNENNIPESDFLFFMKKGGKYLYLKIQIDYAKSKLHDADLPEGITITYEEAIQKIDLKPSPEVELNGVQRSSDKGNTYIATDSPLNTYKRVSLSEQDESRRKRNRSEEDQCELPPSLGMQD